ncbi:MAG: DNA polymerase III subunit [Phycisphaerales bacterium]|nr:MAG: DNA polymerase III subunit [Phycisphaerales bacterium]
MSLGDVEHQPYAQRLIQRAVGRDRVPHAYLFHGPDGVGKETLAVGLAQLLLCSAPIEQKLEGEQADEAGVERLCAGCGVCEECRAVALRTHPDLHLVYRQLNREHPDPVVRKRKALDIGVDVLRHFVIEKVGFTPIRGRAKVFVIREAERITPQAQNALLKTLEEPPGTTFIILLVAALDRLLPTTLSRSQVVLFDGLPTEFVRSKLAELSPDLPSDEVTWYAHFCDGSLGRALEYADDEFYGLNQRLLEGLISMVCTADSSAAGRRDEELVKEWTDESKSLGARYRERDPDITDTEAGRRGLKSIFQLAAACYADVLRIAGGDESAIVNANHKTEIEQASRLVDTPLAVESIKRIARAEHQLDLNANTQLCVETLLSDLSRIACRQTAPTT